MRMLNSFPILWGHETVVISVALVLSLLICFLGIKIFRILMALAGFLSGSMLGFWVAAAVFRQQIIYALAAGAVAGIILAVIAAKIRIVSTMMCTWIFGMMTLMILIRPSNLLWILICMGIGMVLTLISLKFSEPMIILVTSLAGGLGASYSAACFLGSLSWLSACGIGLIFAGIGLAVQFILEGRKRGRQAVATARTIQSEKSIENEIEAARAIISDDDDE